MMPAYKPYISVELLYPYRSGNGLIDRFKMTKTTINALMEANGRAYCKKRRDVWFFRQSRAEIKAEFEKAYNRLNRVQFFFPQPQ